MSPLHKISVESTEIAVLTSKQSDNDYISLTDMARYKSNEPALVISHWMRNVNTLEYLGVWEIIHNPNFKPTEFGEFKNEACYNSFTMSPKKWIESTNAIGIITKSGRYGGGTFAHKDIAFNFGMWLSPTFQLYVVQEFQKLKEQENNPLTLQWNIKRILSKTNYQLHTDAIKHNLIPTLTPDKQRERLVYASEADMLNMVVFGCTAKDWEESNAELVLQGLNIRDAASINQLVVLSNIESFNAELIKLKVEKGKRFAMLRKMAQEQLKVLNSSSSEQQFRKLADTSLSPRALE